MLLNLRKESPKKLRKKNIIPGVIYGKGFKTESIQVEEKELMSAYKEFGQSLVFDVELEGKNHKVYIKNIQYQLLSNQRIHHFDLIYVSKDTLISADIPIVVKGREAIEQQKLYVELSMQTVRAEYPATKGVVNFEFDVTHFEVDQAVYVKDIVVEEGINLLDNPDQVILAIKRPTIIEEKVEDDEVTSSDEEVAETE